MIRQVYQGQFFQDMLNCYGNVTFVTSTKIAMISYRAIVTDYCVFCLTATVDCATSKTSFLILAILQQV